MRNLLQLIVRYSNFLLLVGLEVVAFMFVVRGNRYQQVAVSGAANAVTAYVQGVCEDISSYFHLRSDNRQLLEENTRLYAELQRMINAQGDSLPAYTYADLDYSYLPAKVIAYSDDRHHNYLTLNKGERDGVEKDQGVIGKDGIVGVVRAVSTHFAVVAPVINEDLQISAMISKNGYMATLHWYTPNIHTAALEDVARHVDVAIGDTLVTSGIGAIFPANLPVGVISDVSIGEGDSYYDIDVELATDFRSLRTVQILQFAHREELDSIQ